MRTRAGMSIVPTLTTGHALVAGARGRVSHASCSTPQGTSFAAPSDRTVWRSCWPHAGPHASLASSS